MFQSAQAGKVPEMTQIAEQMSGAILDLRTANIFSSVPHLKWRAFDPCRIG